MNKKFDFSTREERLNFSKYVAEEGIVLLKNEENVLPIKNEKVAIFGGSQLGAQAANEGVRVDTSTAVGITDAIVRAGIEIDKDIYDKYLEWRKGFVIRSYGEWRLSHTIPEMELSLEDVKQTKENGAEKALIVIRRSSYENSDMNIEVGDYILGDVEMQMIKNVCAVYDDVILLLHIGCNIDLGFLDEYKNIKGILYLNQLGVNGSLGMAEILLGNVNPSGKLTVSLSKHFEDYPSSANFGQHGGGLLQDYKEDIYVGYRYFESFEGADKNLVYPFGYGISYTNFKFSDIEYKETDKIEVSLNVTNIGSVAGKQVVQMYFNAPELQDGAVLGAPKVQLCGYEKTKLLEPGESQKITLTLEIDDMKSYDDLGVLGEKSCYVLEKGSYKILVGENSRSLTFAGEHIEKENRIVERCHTIATTLTERLNRKGEYEKLPQLLNSKERFYGISSIGETVILPSQCSDREISDFSVLLAGESATYNILPGAGGAYRITFCGGYESTSIADLLSLEVAGVEVKNPKVHGNDTIEINLPLSRCKMKVTPKKDNVDITRFVFEKVDAKTVIKAEGENYVDVASFYEGDFCVSLANFEDDGWGNSGSYLIGFDFSGRHALFKLEVEEAGTYDLSFRYASCHEPRPVNSVITILASNIVQPLGGSLLEKTYEYGNDRVFKNSDKFKITLPAGVVYLKFACEETPFPDVCGLYITKNDGEITEIDISLDKIREKNSAYKGIPKRKLIDDPALYPKVGIQFKDVYKNPELMKDFLAQLSNRELATIVSGTTNNLTEGGDVGCNSPIHERGIPAAQTADGPCGLRQFDQFPIAFPVGMVLAASFNKELYRQYGEAMAHECMHYEVDYLLGPSINIHRSPAGGRNCSYFSEDPYVCGITSACYIEGLQSYGIAAVLKHYAANNTEFERLKSNSRVSERAMREIYTKGFEIAVRKSNPYAIMSSYNHANDVKVCEDYTMITEIPRDEWHWDGCFFTDWWNDSRHVDELKAGHDLKMSTGDINGVTEALDNGELTREQVSLCAERIIKMLMKLRRIKKNLDSES